MSDMLPVTFYWACWDQASQELVALFAFDQRQDAEEFAAGRMYQLYPAVIQGAAVVKQP